MTTPHADDIGLLVELLRVRRPLLFVGAGVSANAGYPLWTPLVRQLAKTFCHGFVHTGDDLRDVDLIADAADKAGRRAEFLKFLERTFSWDGAANKDLRFPRRLISLGFAGLLTTNFDPLLEYAVAAEYSRPGDIRICEPVDVLNKIRLLRRICGSATNDLMDCGLRFV